MGEVPCSTAFSKLQARKESTKLQNFSIPIRNVGNSEGKLKKGLQKGGKEQNLVVSSIVPEHKRRETG